jgi:flagellar biosynthesis protein FlhF
LIRVIPHKITNGRGRLISEITVEVPQAQYLSSIGIDEEEELIEEIETLKSQMGRLKSIIGKDGENGGAVRHVMDLLEERGLKKEWLKQRIEPLIGTSVAEDEKLLISYLLEEIDEEILVAEEEYDLPKTLMLVGPTGVGKTTTIAKLAARYTYMLDERYKVAMINLDTFRAGAFEQLENFAGLLNINHIWAKDVASFSNALERLSDHDLILVDTAGISPYDTDRLIKTVEFLRSVESHKVSVALVLSATAKYADMQDIFEHFSFINIESTIVTKFDETRRIGELIAFLTEKRLPVSYLSTGQKIPEDLMPAQKKSILERFAGELNV